MLVTFVFVSYCNTIIFYSPKLVSGHLILLVIVSYNTCMLVNNSYIRKGGIHGTKKKGYL